MKEKLIDLIKAEITFLAKMMADTTNEGWPPHLNQRMNVRIGELRDLYYEITNEIN